MSESDGDSWARPAAAEAARAAPEPTAQSNGHTPRLVPRPLDRPAVGRPSGNGVALQRPPNAGSDGAAADPALWSGADDPWRNPTSGVTLGPPPVTEAAPAVRVPGEGARLSLREVLFGRRVQRRALAVLGLVALLVGAAGGLVGRLTADGASRLTDPGATLSPVAEGKERPPGSVADIAARTVPAVVSLEVRVGEEAGTGSGIVIQGDGYVLTNNHVVAPAAAGAGSRLDAVFADGTRAPARIVGRDPKTDLAVVKVDVANPVVAAIGSSAGLAVGDG